LNQTATSAYIQSGAKTRNARNNHNICNTDNILYRRISLATIVDIPLYDPVLFGNPLYVWIILILTGAIAIILIAVKTEIIDPLQPVWGFRDAVRNNKPQMLVQGMNGKMWLETVEHVANIFKSMRLPLMWIVTIPVVGQMGKVNTSIVSDDWNIIHNIDIDYAIVEIVHRWNAEQKNIISSMVKEDDDGNIIEYTEDEKLEFARTRMIYNWDSFNTHLMNGDLTRFVPEGVVLPPLRVVNLNEIKIYLPKWDAAHHAGYINQAVAERSKDDEKQGNTMVKYAIISGAILLICAVFSYLIITTAK
jgi:Flp pilus assembly pilin Flp